MGSMEKSGLKAGKPFHPEHNQKRNDQVSKNIEGPFRQMSGSDSQSNKPNIIHGFEHLKSKHCQNKCRKWGTMENSFVWYLAFIQNASNCEMKKSLEILLH